MAATQTLPQLMALSREVFDAIIENQGALTPEIEAALAHVETNLPEKIDSYAFILDRLEMEEVYWKEKAEKYARIAKGCSSTMSFLKDRIKQVALENGKTELLGHDNKFTLVNSKPSVEINNEELIEAIYKKEVVTYKIDKKKIEEDLKLGLPVAGASLRETKALRLTANKKVGA